MSKPDIRALTEMDLEQAPSPEVREAFRVFIGQDAFDHLVEHGHEDTSVEVGGVLVGRPARDDGGPFVVVEEIIDALHCKEGVTELTFTHDAWEHINNEMDAHHEDRKIVGWYHTHPGFGLFLSEQDMFIQKSFFDLPFQVALVYDPLSREHASFVWREGEVWRLRCYWIGEQPHLWDGDRLSAKPRKKKKKTGAIKAVKDADGGAEDELDDDEELEVEPRPRPPRGEDEEGTPNYVVAIMVGLLALALGGAGGFFYRDRGAVQSAAAIKHQLAMAKGEGALEAVRLLRVELLSGVKAALNREKVMRPVAEVRQQLSTALDKITEDKPKLGPDGKPAPPAAPAIDPKLGLEQARGAIKGAVTSLAKMEVDALAVQLMVARMEQESSISARSVAMLGKETMRLRSGMGHAYAELAQMAAAAGDTRRAQRLLAAAATFDPAGQARHKKAVQSNTRPKGAAPPTPTKPGGGTQ